MNKVGKPSSHFGCSPVFKLIIVNFAFESSSFLVGKKLGFLMLHEIYSQMGINIKFYHIIVSFFRLKFDLTKEYMPFFYF